MLRLVHSLFSCKHNGKEKIMAKEITYEIVEEIAVLSESDKGWTKELNLVSWNGGEPKYDIRDWAPDREKIGKGITLTEEEMNILVMEMTAEEE